jgi:1-acyl-sn-glycerol-3-phosphate acyltransferase
MMADIDQVLRAGEKLAQDGERFLELFLRACAMPSDRLTGWSLNDRDPQVIDELLPFFSWVYRYYFRVQTDGWDHIPATGRVLLVGSHNGGLAAPDTVMMTYDWYCRFGPERPTYALMDPRIWQVFPGLARLATQVGTVQASSQMAIAALRRDASLLIYPGGIRDVFRPHALSDRICFFGEKGFIKLALLTETPICPLISCGAHDTLWVLTDLYPLLNQIHQWGIPWPLGLDPEIFPIYLGLPWGLSLGPLPNIPLPINIHTRVCPLITFDRYGHAAAHDDDYIDACYEQVRATMQQYLDALFLEVEGKGKR